MFISEHIAASKPEHEPREKVAAFLDVYRFMFMARVIDETEVELVELSRLGSIRVECNVAGAQVLLDGEEVGVTPLRIADVVEAKVAAEPADGGGHGFDATHSAAEVSG